MQTSPHILLTPAQRVDWLRLIRTENVGPRTFRALIHQFGNAAAALEALPTLSRRGGRLLPPRSPTRAEIEDELSALEAMNASLVALGEADYPLPLGMLDDAPPLLAVRGRKEMLRAPMIALVGSRNASAAGRTMTGHLARDLGAAGWCVVSGLARGIDTVAHEASLSSGTVGVFAGGLARPYPAENIRLMEKITQSGVLVSEMPVKWEPRARDFPRRNRLVSGMSYGVVVVEAALRSGSLITARLAAEQGREVFAVPGSPLDPRAAGGNRLIKQGATLVCEAQDILEVLNPMVDMRGFSRSGSPAPMPRQADMFLAEESHSISPPGSPAEDVRARVNALLGPTPIAIDDLVRHAECTAAEVQALLLELDLAGRLDRPGTGLVALV
ncbi:DNA-processing protein DprA [Xanthobacter sp. TB0136]|uniref:DNA-processing protein DprA n=1 Tax=Xanthobacter sp. TB0136 TaxID=3459177 RepID=UPI0040392B9E